MGIHLHIYTTHPPSPPPPPAPTCLPALLPQVRREYNKVADALSNQAISDYRSGVNPHLWRLDEAVAAANAAAAELEWGGEGAGAGDGGTSDLWSSDAAAKRPRWE